MTDVSDGMSRTARQPLRSAELPAASPRRWGWLPIVAVVACAVVASRLAAALPAGAARSNASNAVLVLATVAATVLPALRARRAQGSARRHLMLMAAAAGCWMLGELYWAVAQLVVTDELPFPSLADLGFVAFIPVAMLGLLSAPSSRLHATSRFRLLADAFATGCTLLLVVWTVVLHPALEVPLGSGLLAGTVGVLYPSGDLLLLTVAVTMGFSARGLWRRPLALYGLAFIALFTADAGFALLVADGTYQTGAWADLGWVAGWSLLALATTWIPLEEEPDAGQVHAGSRWSTALLLVLLVLTGTALAVQGLRREPLAEHPLLLILLVAVFVAATMRASVARAEGEAFARQLNHAALALQETQARHDFALQAAEMGSWTWSAVDDVWELSEEDARRVGIERDLVAGPQRLRGIELADLPRVVRTFAALTPSNPVYDIEFGLRTPEGVVVHLRSRGRAEFDVRGAIVGRSGVVFNVTRDRALADELRSRDANAAAIAGLGARAQRASASATLFQDALVTLGAAIEARACCIWHLGQGGDSAQRLAAWRSGEKPGLRPDDDVTALKAPDPLLARIARVAAATDGLPDLGERDDDWVFPIAAAAGWGALVVQPTPSHRADVELRRLVAETASILGTAIKGSEADRALWMESRRDALTGLPNRLRLGELLEEALLAEEQKPLALAYLDLDDFKQVNDRFGHPVGDRLLQEVANRLQKSLRGTDVVARIGGDEFAVLMTEAVEESSIAEVLERLRLELAAPLDLGPTLTFPRASIGVATTFETPRQVSEFLRNADLAMYVSKREGAGAPVPFRPDFHDDAERDGQLADALRGAFDRGEFAVHFQPVVDLPTGALCGAEGLIRWVRPNYGVQPPAVFLDTLERLGLMGQLSRFVIHEVCAWAAVQPRVLAGADFAVAANITARDLESPRFIEVVSRALNESGLAPERLCLEITEAGLLADVSSISPQLEQLRSLGVRMAIDDFGTGYSSLRQLKVLPVDIVKIDCGFVDGLATELDDSAFVAAIIGMAHTLSLDVIAEGVETVKQRDALIALGCEMAQGYLFGRPAPGDLAWTDRRPVTAGMPRPRRIAAVLEPQVQITVVVADDLEDGRRLLRRQLVRDGAFAVVGEAVDGVAAADLVRDLQPDVVVLDLGMLRPDRLEALARMRRESPGTAVIVLSGCTSAEDERAALAAGARGCIAKGPFDVVGRLRSILSVRVANAGR